MRTRLGVTAQNLIYGACLALTSCATTHAVKPGPHRAAMDVKLPAVTPIAEPEAAITLGSEVTKVTVYSDRARVTRRATAKITNEPQVFAFRKLPGWVDDSSVRVTSGAGRIVDVRVERRFLAQATDRSWQRAQARYTALQRQVAALDDELAVLEAQKRQIEAIKAFSLTKINKDSVIGEMKVQSYREVFAFIGNSLRATAKARREVAAQRDELMPTVRASQRTLDEMKNLMKLEETTVLVTLQGSRPVASAIELTYMLPGATWEPMHELRVSATDSRQAELRSFAVITQTSGEDWRNAQLSFSTQSATRAMRIPELEALTLGDTERTTRSITTKVSSFRRAQQAFEQQGQLWNKAALRSSLRNKNSFNQHVYQRNIKYLQVVQEKTVRIFAALRKRGTTAHFKANAPSIVRGDGHPVRMRIGEGRLEAEQRIVAVPEQSLNAARTLRMRNNTGQSLLPGGVALFRDGAFLGMTEVDYIAEGERFSLFLSVADHLKITRTLDRKQSSLVRKKRNKMQVSFLVAVENLSAQPTVLSLLDRVPVSENKEITIDRVRIGGGAKPDSRGLVRWELKLQPRERRELHIAYRIEYPPQLVLETRRRHDRERAMRRSRRRHPAPAASPTSRRKTGIGEQLMDLESRL